MKAVVCTKYGPPEVLKIVDLEKPKPKDNEVLVKIMATAVNSADVRIRGFKVPRIFRLPIRFIIGFTRPRQQILGSVMAGIVEQTGDKIKVFKTGDKVFAITGLKFGCYAEYICVKENSPITLKPMYASYEEATAIIFGGTTAIYFLHKAKINTKSNLNVLIYGATGSVGSSAVQIAKYYKATVTSVCSTEGLAMAKSIGSDFVIDYTKQNFVQIQQKFDIIFDAVGKINKKMCAKILAKNGKYISVAGFDTAHETRDQLRLLRTLYDKNKLKPLIDRSYNLDQIVEAHSYVDTGKKKEMW
jgi:NADPH:quinone reductase-like Zn-dependent oxidoreductase